MDIIIGLLRFPFLALMAFFTWFLVLAIKQGPSRNEEIASEKTGYLQVISGEEFLEVDKGHRFFISDYCTIGRNTDNHIVVSDPYSSNFHTLIEKKGRKYLVSDMDSKNGTMLNNILITRPVKLKPEDSVRIGSVIFRFNIG
jgi:pSer/pThr/pTyr-binding forkhead associated (FHA) protein